MIAAYIRHMMSPPIAHDRDVALEVDGAFRLRTSDGWTGRFRRPLTISCELPSFDRGFTLLKLRDAHFPKSLIVRRYTEGCNERSKAAQG